MHNTTHLHVDLAAVESDDEVSLLVELTAPAAAPDPDAVVHTAVVVLDRSGSMAGLRLEHAKRALVALVDRLAEHDRFGLVTFDDQAELVVPAEPVGATGRAALKRTIDRIVAGGSTDLGAGYLRALGEAARVAGPEGATLVVLSDGHANQGITDPDVLATLAAQAHANGTTTSTIGIGLGYDESALLALARGGSGNHAFAEQADDAAAAVAGEIDGLLSKAAQAATLLVSPLAEVTQVGVLNDLPAHAVGGGVLVELGDLYAGETRRVLITLGVPAVSSLGLAQVATLTAQWVALPSLEQETVTLPVSVNVVPTDEAAGRIPAPEVTREKLFLETQRRKREATEALGRGDHDAARAVLGAAIDGLAGAPVPAGTCEADELTWLHETVGMLDDRDEAYVSRRLAADHLRKARYTNRQQGGETRHHGES